MVGIIVGAVCLVVLLAIGIGANLNLLKPGGKAAQVLATTTTPPSPTMPKLATPSPIMPKLATPDPTLMQPAPQDTPMPDDVRAWLEHLQRIEAYRTSMTADQIGDMLVFMTGLQSSKVTDAISGILGDDDEGGPPKPTASENLTNKTDETRDAWRVLMDEFRKLPPPAECVPIATSYDETLGETSAMMVEILDALQSAQDNPQAAIAALTKMQGTSSGRIDSLAKDSDRQVGAICDKYKTRKWFSIASDVGGGMMGKLGGLGF